MTPALEPASATPFTDPALVAGPLYAAADRLAQRTSALHRAKVIGADATDTIAALAADADPAPRLIIDVGCGRGTASVRLARQYPPAAILAVDQSPGLLTVVRHRLRAQHRRTALVAADFHHLPLPAATADLALAGFCLYHSPRPQYALAEIARCVRPGGWIIATTKSADSYHAIDTLIATSGLDPDADQRPSLYQTFHTGNAEAVATAAGLTVQRRIDQQHAFEFADLDHLAAYATTCPKYHLPANLTDAASLAAELRRRVPDRALTATSTVTYLVMRRMTLPVYIKHYVDSARAIAAGAHLTWLTQLESGVRLPHLHGGTSKHLILEHLAGRPVQPADLEHVAAVLGRLHGAAHTRELHAAHLDQDYATSTGPTIRRFPAGREHVLTDTDVGLANLPAALYKDCNLRNVVITAEGAAFVDFDDLTLAPFGYDLAKLVVSTAMTHGRLPADQIRASLHAYNVSVHNAGARTAECTWLHLTRYTEIHHQLTARYIGRNSYHHPWPAVRPWPAPSTEPRPR